MLRSPLVVDQRTCPSFDLPSEAGPRYFDALPLSLRGPRLAPADLPPRGGSPGPTRRTAREVYESLMRSAALAQERLEAARAAHAALEASRRRSAPRISAMGRAMVRDEDIVERLERLHREKQRLDESDRMDRERETRMRLEAFFRPSITPRARHAESRVMSRTESVRGGAREAALLAAAARHSRIAEGMDGGTGIPRINAHSAELARKARERDGLCGMSHVDAMLVRDRVAKLSAWERCEQERSVETESPRRAKPRPNGNEHENTNAAEQIPGLRAMEERQRHYRQRREETIRAIVEAERRMHTPTIDPVSEMIAAGLSVSSTERLTARAAEEFPSATRSQAQLSHPKPTPRARSGVYERMRLWQRRRDEKVERLRGELGSANGEDAVAASPSPRSEKVLPLAEATPRALTRGRSETATPIVLSLRPMRFASPRRE